MSGSALRREVFVVSSGKHDQAEVRSRRSHMPEWQIFRAYLRIGSIAAQRLAPH